MSEKIIKSRIINKHAAEEDWNKATSFIPLLGEIIVYDIDSNYNYERIKIGDGKTSVVDLPFITSSDADSAGSDYGITTAGTGAAYTATVPGIDALESGVSFIMVPHTTSTSTAPTLNVNGFGAKNIRRRLSSIGTGTQVGYTASWLASGVPFRVVYDGTQWIVDGLTKPAAADLYGAVQIAKGGTGATDAATALTNLGAASKTDLDNISALVGDTSVAEQIAGATEGLDVQSNWNEWDEESLAFIQNKPFYDSRRDIVALDNATITVPYSSSENILFPINSSSSFNITIDGVSYEKLGKETSYAYGSSVGNYTVYSVVAGDYTFKHTVYASGSQSFNISGTSGTHTISVSYYGGSLVRLDKKYLPYSVVTITSSSDNEGKVAQVVKNEWTATQMYCDTTFENTLLSDYTFEIAEGSTYYETSEALFKLGSSNYNYYVTVNGTVHGPGNTSMVFGGSEGNYDKLQAGLVFKLYHNTGVFRIEGDPGTYTITVVETGGKFVQVEEKFIPDTIARVSDVEEVQAQLDNKASTSHTHDDINSSIDNLSSLVGDESVSTQISTAIANKSDQGHSHPMYVNQNAFSNVKVGTTTVAADTATDTLTLVAGSNVTITPDATNDQITIAATDTVYTHPSYTARTGVPTADATPGFGGTFNVSQPVSDSSGHITAINSRTVTIPSTTATTSAAGLMSADDKTKLDGIATGATNVTVDSALSSTSTNPVQNKVVNTAISNLNTEVDALSTLVGDTSVSQQITDVVAGYSKTDHTHAASKISGGTFAGAVIAHASTQTYSTSLLRNSKLASSDTNPTSNGEICWTYE